MFRIAPLPPLPPTPKTPVLTMTTGAVDADRGLVVRRIAGSRDHTLSGWLLESVDALVPFDVREHFRDGDHGLLAEYTITSLGFSRIVDSEVGVRIYTFATVEHQRAWMALAAEGVLTAKVAHHATSKVPKQVRVIADGSTYESTELNSDQGD